MPSESRDAKLESIKLKTEFLKFYFISIIGTVTGVISFIFKPEVKRREVVIIVFGTLLLLFLVILLVRCQNDIKKLIKALE